MQESPFAPWANFYVIVGTAAATLTGLVFVTITLVTSVRTRRPAHGIATFSTPSVVHFCGALAAAAILTAPWRVLWHAGLLLALSGIVGLAYLVVVVRRMRGQNDYQPVLEDWVWHAVFPLVAYVALVVASALLSSDPAPMLFVVGAATMLLLFIGIHNAWDNVTYLVVDLLPRQDEVRGADGDRASGVHRGDEAPSARSAGAIAPGSAPPDSPG